MSAPLILERLEVGSYRVYGLNVVYRGDYYRPLATDVAGIREHWLCPMGLWANMIGTRHIPEGFVSSDLCSIIPETAMGIQRWVSCWVHDGHYEAARRGLISRSQGDFWFSRNGYTEHKWWGGTELGARFVQSAAFVTQVGGGLAKQYRVPLILAVGALLVTFVLMALT